jgi:hypothetical protein
MPKHSHMPILLLSLAICGCMQNLSQPTTPNAQSPAPYLESSELSNPHRLWGLYALAFSEDHSSCTVAPSRAGAFHLNALKFLEVTPCTNCLTISNLKKLGGGVIDLDVTIHHPFPNQPIYSAFDVKGIIMFNGSLKVRFGEMSYTYPEFKNPEYVSWARLGDWELLNPDGYSFYWCPIFNPDSQWPITHYLPGKFSAGTPNAHYNGYKEFHTDDQRHLFRAGHSVTSTYRIQTQPGPMTVGYAIDACWEPPIHKPVTNPIADFPPSANQSEPYQFSVVVNDGQPLTFDNFCHNIVYPFPDHSLVKLQIHQWNGQTVTKQTSLLEYEHPDQFPPPPSLPGQYIWPSSDEPLIECDPPCGDDCYCGICEGFYHNLPGWYRLVVETHWGNSGVGWHDWAITMTDFYYDPQ